MKPWTVPNDIPNADMVDEAENSIRAPELGAALFAALEALFAKYPPRVQKKIGSFKTDKEQAMCWRDDALDSCTKGWFTSAIVLADNTGIPQEELIAVSALLFG
jgi:hypothetical protein